MREAARATAKVRPKPAKVLVQKGAEDLYYVEKKAGELFSLSGKPEPDNADDWVLLR